MSYDIDICHVVTRSFCWYKFDLRPDGKYSRTYKKISQFHAEHLISRTQLMHHTHNEFYKKSFQTSKPKWIIMKLIS